MSESESYSTNDDVYEQLVAYLDGELDAETSQQVERRLVQVKAGDRVHAGILRCAGPWWYWP